MTREIGKQCLPREKYLKLCLQEMMIYIVFVVIVAIRECFILYAMKQSAYSRQFDLLAYISV